MKRFTLLFAMFVVISTVSELTAAPWDLPFGGTMMDTAYDIIETDDGNYIFVGSTGSNGAQLYDNWYVKFDTNGNILWEKIFGGEYEDYAYSIKEFPTGGYTIAGVTYSFGSGGRDMHLVKIDDDGNVEWDRAVGTSDDEYASDHVNSIENDGSVVMVGRHYPELACQYYDTYLVKIDQNGVIWEKSFGEYDYEDRSSRIIKTTDGGYIISGMTYTDTAGGKDMWVIKTDADGNELWSQVYGNEKDEEAYGIINTLDGGYIVCGSRHTYEQGKAEQAYLVKIDNLGNIEWEYIYGGAENDKFMSVIQNTDGSYTLSGETRSLGAGSGDCWVYFVDVNGIFISQETFGGTDREYSTNMISSTIEDSYFISAVTQSFGAGSYDAYIVKMDRGVGIENNYELGVKNYELKQNYPNPFNPLTRINFEFRITNYELAEIVVFNSVGKKVWSSGNLPFTTHNSSLYFDGSKFNSGIYFYSLIIDGMKMDTKSMILLK